MVSLIIWLYIEQSAEKMAQRLRVGRVAQLRARLMGLRRRKEAVMLTLLAEEERIRAERRRIILRLVSDYSEDASD